MDKYLNEYWSINSISKIRHNYVEFIEQFITTIIILRTIYLYNLMSSYNKI